MVPSDDLNDDVSIGEEGDDEAPERMNLDIKVTSPSACERHVTVTIPHEDVQRYFDKAFSDMMGSATVPGFRAGRAPRKLIEARFRKDVSEQVKGSLLMDSLTQVTEDQNFSAISEPDLDASSLEVPAEGPLTYEFDIEVRPEFDLPDWRNLEIDRPTREFAEADIQRQIERLLGQFGKLIPHDGPAATGDYISCNLTFKNGDQVLSEGKEEVIRIRPVLSFRDCKIEQFDKLMKGVRAGQTREGKAQMGDAGVEALRGKQITAIFDVLEVKKLSLPDLTPEFLTQLGFDGEGELKDAVKESLARQLEYHQQQEARRQLTAALTKAAQWDLPPKLLQRQSSRELQRAVLELQRNGFSEDDIRAHGNELRQNSAVNTARALKEHFILERIGEEEHIEVEPADYDAEVALIAKQSDESPRRVRARLEKQGMMDALRNQIIERKVIDVVLKHAKFKDVPYKSQDLDTEAVDQTVGGEEEEAGESAGAEASQSAS
jgi:trigger factor